MPSRRVAYLSVYLPGPIDLILFHTPLLTVHLLLGPSAIDFLRWCDSLANSSPEETFAPPFTFKACRRQPILQMAERQQVRTELLP